MIQNQCLLNFYILLYCLQQDQNLAPVMDHNFQKILFVHMNFININVGNVFITRS